MNRGMRASGILLALLVGFCATARGARAAGPAWGEAVEGGGSFVKDIEGKDWRKKQDAGRSLAKMVERNTGKLLASRALPVGTMLGSAGVFHQKDDAVIVLTPERLYELHPQRK